MSKPVFVVDFHESNDVFQFPHARVRYFRLEDDGEYREPYPYDPLFLLELICTIYPRVKPEYLEFYNRQGYIDFYDIYCMNETRNKIRPALIRARRGRGIQSFGHYLNVICMAVGVNNIIVLPPAGFGQDRCDFASPLEAWPVLDKIVNDRLATFDVKSWGTQS